MNPRADALRGNSSSLLRKMKQTYILLALIGIVSAAPSAQYRTTAERKIDCADAYEDCYKYASSLYEKAAW
jgi:hypothetical protein